MKKTLLILCCSMVGILSALCQGNNYNQDYTRYSGLAMTPPMGWNSWNKFSCNVDEQLIRATADAMVSSGLKDAGYVYINVDDCWHGDRDTLGFIHPDQKRFPSGMKALADYVHSKGLKLGVYSDAGSLTCGGRPGSRGYEFQDALTYARWGVDYLKYDWCNTEGLQAEGAYKTIAAALKRAGRPIVLSICEWGGSEPWKWAKNIGQLWRTTGDIFNCFDCIEDHGTWKSWGVMQILEKQDGLREYAGPGHWNDPDMLEVGNGMPVNEDRAHFSMWCMIAAPLIAGNDLRNLSEQTKSVLLNKEVIAVDQDSLGVQGFRYSTRDSVETWLKPLSHGDWAVCFLNRSRTAKTVEFSWKEHVINDTLSGSVLDAGKMNYAIRNLWEAGKPFSTEKPFKGVVQGRDVVLLRVLAEKR